MKPIQARAARHGLRLTAKDVATGAGVSDFTVKRFEKGGAKSLQDTVDAMRDFYRSHGVRFVEDGDEYGVLFGPVAEPRLPLDASA